MDEADDMRRSTADAATAFRALITGTDLSTPVADGWTAKEMVAHVAFWLETTQPFVSGMWRGDPSAFDHTFPSGFTAATDGSWPEAEVHNAREAAWAREQSDFAVLDRLDAAIASLDAFLETVTDEEAIAQAEYYADIAHHLRAHRSELAAT